MGDFTYFPDFLKNSPNSILFTAPHCAFSRFVQKPPIPRDSMVYLKMHCLVIVLKGEKIIHTHNKQHKIKAKEGFFLKSGNYLFSNIAPKDESYEAILIFFDNAEIIRFIHKYREKLPLEYSCEGLEFFCLRENLMLSLIASSFEYYLQQSPNVPLSLVSHKFEELFLFLLSEYKEVFVGFLKGIIQEFSFELNMIFDYCNTDFQSVSQMAEFAHMDNATFSRKFKQTFFISPKSWLDEKRFNKAKFYLEYSNKNINQICQECGFSSSWFIERFKKKYQLTPKQYQKSKNLYFLSKNTH
ncbi:helix-turn-helix transcriptional regulator [Helicobacter pullorum]|uniref:helix-turn-helix transcriptional regulator n=1 Tax=Helicobacter pullorum TaxID=35818 RepID=UPI0009818BF3|nr:AraC family transcriptional regulator [Helicobacter pullorum]